MKFKIKNLKISNQKKLKIIFVFSFLLFTFYFIIGAHSAQAGFRMPPNSLGLVGYWALNDGSGTKATDYSGNGNTGTLTNGAFWGAGKRGGSLACDGTNDYASTTYTPSGLTDFTISAWINTGANSTEFPVSSRDASAANGIFILYENNGSGIEVGFSNAGNLTRKRSNTSLDVGVWHHVVGTHAAGATSMTLYIDGVSTGVSAESAASNPGNSGVLTFCRDGSSSTPLYFSGFVDDARVYSRALTGTEVTALYNSGVTKLREGSANGLVGHWKLDDASGTKATDSSGSGNTGTLTNFALSGAVSNWITGKRGGALDFDGTNDRITTGNISFPTTLSVCFWIYPKANAVSEIILHGTTAATQTGFEIYQTGLGVGLRGGSITNMTSGSILVLDTWQYICGSISGTTGNIYYNGSLSVTSGGLTAPQSSGNHLNIGSYEDGSYPFSGSLDDIRIYNRVLGSTEISTLYNSGAVTRNASTAGRGGNLTSGLVGHWTFDGSKLTTTTATDSSGSGNSGTLTNGPTPIQGKLGQALSFDGTDDFVDTASVSTYSFGTGDFTVAFWIKTTDVTGNILSRGSGVSAVGNWAIVLFFSNLYWQDAHGTTNLYNRSATSIIDGNWHHILIKRSGTTNTMYFDTVQQGASVTDNTNYSPTNIFRMGNGANGNLAGSIDDVRVYNRALTDAEVTQLYNLR